MAGWPLANSSFGVLVRKPYRQSQTGRPVAPTISALSVPGPTQIPIPSSSRMTLFCLRYAVLVPLSTIWKTKLERLITTDVKIPRRPWESSERVYTASNQTLLDMPSGVYFGVQGVSPTGNEWWVMGSEKMVPWTGYMGHANTRLTITILSLPTHYFGLFFVDTHSFEYIHNHLDI